MRFFVGSVKFSQSSKSLALSEIATPRVERPELATTIVTTSMGEPPVEKIENSRLCRIFCRGLRTFHPSMGEPPEEKIENSRLCRIFLSGAADFSSLDGRTTGGENRKLPLMQEFFQSGWADLNRRPPRPKRGALPTALHPEVDRV